MGCCGDREKGQDFVKTEQRWDYINLDDFRTKSCWTPVAYGWLLLMFVVSVSVYAVDTFTAINLIAFDHWSGQIQPAIPFSIARWIFAGCIIASFVLLIYRWWRAVRVMKQGGVAKSYLDPLAVRVQCIRMGKEGRGYKRFLVFAELTKSRKGADYVALFAYFSFEAWLRIIFAEGPRQVVNAITLYSVMQAKLIPEGDHAAPKGTSSFVQFWINVGALAESNKLQAAILFGMLWTLLIWVLAAVSLAVSVILYIIFLWHHIPADDGGLGKYCRNKINRRMERVVRVKVDKALKKENAVLARQEALAERDGLKPKLQPTLPDISVNTSGDAMPPLSRQDTMTTLSEYESRPGSLRHSSDNIPRMPGPFNDAYRPGPRRHGTQRSDTSWSSYNSNAPLMSSAGEMGMQTPVSAGTAPWSAGPTIPRSATAFSQYTDRTTTPGLRAPRMPNEQAYQMESLSRSGVTPNVPPYPEQSTRGEHFPPAGVGGSYFPPVGQDPNSGRLSPAQGPPPRSFTPHDQPMRSFTPGGPPPRSFTPARGPSPPRSFNSNGPPPRSFTPGGPPPRSYTSYGPSPPNRPITPYDEPTLPKIDTNVPANLGRVLTNHSSATPSSAQSLIPSQYQNQYEHPSRSQPEGRPPQQEYRSYGQSHSMNQRTQANNNSYRDSGVDDILSHY